MSKLDKKKKRLQERITFLEDEMRKNLIQKTSNTKEINIGEYQTKIKDLRIELTNLK